MEGNESTSYSSSLLKSLSSTSSLRVATGELELALDDDEALLSVTVMVSCEGTSESSSKSMEFSRRGTWMCFVFFGMVAVDLIVSYFLVVLKNRNTTGIKIYNRRNSL